MKYVKWLWAGIVLLFGAFFFERSKRKSAEAVNTNVETKEEVQKIQATKDLNNASIQAEEDKRNDIKKAEDPKPASDSDLIDFLNKK